MTAMSLASDMDTEQLTAMQAENLQEHRNPFTAAPMTQLEEMDFIREHSRGWSEAWDEAGRRVESGEGDIVDITRKNLGLQPG